jgi:hypothetical protein
MPRKRAMPSSEHYERSAEECRRLDASRIQAVANSRRDLFEAMKQVAETGHGPLEQTPSMGCSIKWKD